MPAKVAFPQRPQNACPAVLKTNGGRRPCNFSEQMEHICVGAQPFRVIRVDMEHQLLPVILDVNDNLILKFYRLGQRQ